MIFHYDVRRDLVDTTNGIVFYSSYHNYVFSLRWLTKPQNVADDALLIKLCLDLFLCSLLIVTHPLLALPFASPQHQ